MSINPTSTVGGDAFSNIIPYLQIAKGGYDLLGAVRKGNISQGMGGLSGMYGGYQGMNKPKPGEPQSSYEQPGGPTTESKFGMTRDEFMALDPELRQRMLQQLMGR